MLLRTSVSSSGVESDSRTFVFGNYIDEVLMMRQPTGTEYLYGHDHLYSPAVLFDAAGTVVRRYEYDAYGRMRPYSAAWGAVPWPAWQILGNYYAFTGRELDRVGTSQTGFLEIMYYRARYYDPDSGRFLQPDPLSLDPAGGRINPFAPTSQYADGMNRYEYAKNNSCRYLDPLGLLPPPSPISPYPPLPVPYPLPAPFPPAKPKPALRVAPANECDLYVYCGDIIADDSIEKGANAIGSKHCDLRWTSPDANRTNETAYDVFLDKSSQRRMLAGNGAGKKCSCVSCDEIKDCAARLQYASRNNPYSAIGNNCHTWAARALSYCCLKSKWKPAWHAGDPTCLKYTVVYGTAGPIIICTVRSPHYGL